MSKTDLTVEEVIDSLVADDEDAIAHHFGDTWPDLAVNNSPKFARALVFVVLRREGATDDDARNAARALTTKECNVFFAEPSEEEAGKDESPEPELPTSPTSVSSPAAVLTSTGG